MLLIEAFTLLKDERTVCTTLRWALSSCSLAPTKLYCACFTGVNLTALIQRQGEAQAHLVLAHIAVIITLRIGTIRFRATVGGVRNAGRGAQAQGWQMAVLRLTNLLAGQVPAQARLQQRQVAVFRLFQQGVNGLRLIRFEAVDVQEASSG